MTNNDRSDAPRSSIGSWAARLAKFRTSLISITAAAAVIVTLLTLAVDGWVFTWATGVGLLATVWALALALAIYVITARDTDRIVDEFETLAEQIGALLPDPEAQTAEQRLAALERFAEYVDALRAELPAIPVSDIVSIERPGAGKGNRPVQIATARGKRYSVYKGGRAKSGFTVTKLPDEEQSADE